MIGVQVGGMMPVRATFLVSSLEEAEERIRGLSLWAWVPAGPVENVQIKQPAASSEPAGDRLRGMDWD